jgi:hypothetical protein
VADNSKIYTDKTKSQHLIGIDFLICGYPYANKSLLHLTGYDGLGPNARVGAKPINYTVRWDNMTISYNFIIYVPFPMWIGAVITSSGITKTSPVCVTGETTTMTSFSVCLWNDVT